MAYGTANVDVIQSSTANVPVQFNDGNGTQVGTLCRAWVNFNGTGTVAIRGSFNVSSITDNGTGDYTVNFTNALPDGNYAVAPMAKFQGITSGAGVEAITFTTTAVRVRCINLSAALYDTDYFTVGIFR